jgi:hypothetical protein
MCLFAGILSAASLAVVVDRDLLGSGIPGP